MQFKKSRSFDKRGVNNLFLLFFKQNVIANKKENGVNFIY